MLEKQPRGRLVRAIRRTLVFGLCVFIAGCAAAPSEPVDRQVDIATVKRTQDEAAPGIMTQLELQAQLMSFADRLTITLADVWDPIEFGDTTPELRSTAHGRWLYPSVAASGIAAGPDPEAGLLDMVVLATLLRMTVEDYWVPQVFGEQALGAVAAYQALEADIWGLANEVLTPEQAQELHELIQDWRAANPNRYTVSHYRFSEFTRKGRRSSFPEEGQPGGLLAKVGEVTRTADETLLLAERAIYKADRMPIFATAQVKQVMYDMMGTAEFRQVMSTTDGLSELGERYAVLAEMLPSTIATEREAAIHQFMLEFGAERAAAVEQIALETSKERQQAIEQLFDALAEERKDLSPQLMEVLDRAFWLALLLLLIAHVGVVIAVLTYRYLALKLFGPQGRAKRT